MQPLVDNSLHTNSSACSVPGPIYLETKSFQVTFHGVQCSITVAVSKSYAVLSVHNVCICERASCSAFMLCLTCIFANAHDLCDILVKKITLMM